MKTVTVEKSELIKRVEKNRHDHRKIFEEAVEGYKKEAVKLLERHIKKILGGGLERVYISLPEPEDHTADYDRVLEMLKMHIDEAVDIDEESFASYVMDDWSWKRQFLQTNAAYSATAARQLR